MSQELTKEQVRERFLKHISALVDDWHNQNQSTIARMEGLAFSILVLLDGESADLPAFTVSPCPHETDMAYAKERGEDWYPQEGMDISGGLHEKWHEIRRATAKVKRED